MPFAVAHAYEEHDAVVIIAAPVAVIVIEIVGISFDIPAVEILYRDYRDIHIPLCAYALELCEKPLFIIIAEDIRVVDEQRIGSFVRSCAVIGRRGHSESRESGNKHEHTGKDKRRYSLFHKPLPSL